MICCVRYGLVWIHLVAAWAPSSSCMRNCSVHLASLHLIPVLQEGMTDGGVRAVVCMQWLTCSVTAAIAQHSVMILVGAKHISFG